MYALLHTSPRQLDFTHVPDPVVGDDEVLIAVKACGICGSDVKGYTGTTGRRIPPLIMGHEAAGVVAAVGAHVPTLQDGDRVCFDSTVYCNQCAACEQGHYNRCATRQVLGVSVPEYKRHGAFAEFVAVPWWITHPIPETMTFAQAALLEPVAIAVHAVNRAALQPGATVLVIGAGTIGLFVVQAARLQGAGTILVADLSDHRLALAQTLGADVLINPGREDLTTAVKAHTNNQGTEVSFEVVGFGATLRDALAVTRTGGCVVAVGNLEPEVTLNIPALISRELTLRGTYASSGEYRTCIDLVASGRIQVEPLISKTLPLAEGQHAFDRLYTNTENLVKIILEP